LTSAQTKRLPTTIGSSKSKQIRTLNNTMASSEEEDTASVSSAGSDAASVASSHASDAAAPPAVVSDAELALTIVKRQLATLASCRPDVLAAKQRTALIRTVEEAITADPAARTLLAEWKGAYLDY
jgi:hypothetical protein